ncbi:hypothetical protein AVL59_12860 [Streptomyces griseochromogenes]|nr:hypothetical protein AVL59_12860 [Streptomyces griseochromogenes]
MDAVEIRGALTRPCAVTDCSSSPQITHEYDAKVAAEGIRSVLAVPVVVVRRRVRGVLYGALRRPGLPHALAPRAPAPRIAEPALRPELLAACGLLTVARPAGGASLAPREPDVLSWVAAGATDAAVAERLGLRPETVKGYLRSAMRKPGAHTRGEAVSAARRAGLLP